jgi:Family of unknown function (DUF6093)
MTARAAAARARAAADSIMDDACTVARPVPDPPFNPAAGRVEPPPPVAVYSGRCRIRPQGSQDRVVDAGERPLSLWPYVVSIPFAGSAELDDIVTVTASADSTLVGRRLRVRSVVRGTHVSARRLGCEESS